MNKSFSGEFDKNKLPGKNSKAAKQAYKDIRKDPENKCYYDNLGIVQMIPVVLTEEIVLDNSIDIDEYVIIK